MRIGDIIRHRGAGTGLKIVLVALAVAFVLYRFKLAPVPVITHKIQPSGIAAEVMGTGALEARVRATISSRIQEQLAQVLVDQNEPVQAGQLLAPLDDGELWQQVEVYTAALATALTLGC